MNTRAGLAPRTLPVHLMSMSKVKINQNGSPQERGFASEQIFCEFFIKTSTIPYN